MKTINLDSAQVAFLLRELEALDKIPYETLLPGNLGMRYVPPQQGVAEWQEVYTYKMYTKTGRGKKGGKQSDNLPRAGLTMQPTSRRIEQLPASYGWTAREVQQAAATGVPLDTLTVLAARMLIGRKIDDMIAHGDGTDIEGLYTGSQVNLETATTKTGGLPWNTAGNLPDEVLRDITFIIEQIVGGLKQTDTPGFDKFVILVPTKPYSFLANTPRSVHSDTSILKWAIGNNPWLESIEPWWQGDTADAGGTGPRMVAYPRNPIAVASLVPQEFRPLSPQEVDLDIKVPVAASSGGTIWRYPVTGRYMDGIFT